MQRYRGSNRSWKATVSHRRRTFRPIFPSGSSSPSRRISAPTAIAANGLRIAAGQGPSRLPNVTAEPAFTKGWFEVQDEGSQVVSELIFAQPGEQVLDYCAGGGKALALSAFMENKGQIHAYDIDRTRLAPIFERLKRAGTRNVQVHEDAAELEALTGRMDRVLVDAPCSGTGTWRRHPDTKWKLTPNEPRGAADPAGRRCWRRQSTLCASRRFPGLHHLLDPAAGERGADLRLLRRRRRLRTGVGRRSFGRISTAPTSRSPGRPT